MAIILRRSRTFAAVLCGLLFAVLFAPLARATSLSTITTPEAITATGGGSELDVSLYSGKARFFITAKSVAGTSPTLDVKLQHSNEASVGASYTTTGTNDIVLRNNTNDNIRLAAKFTQSGARQVKRVGLMLKKNGTITSGKILTLEIQTNNAGDPSGTVVGTADTVQTDNVGTTYAWVTFTFAKPVDLSDATVYWLVLTGDYTVSSSNNVTWRTATVASGGNSNVFDSAYAAVATNSHEFYIHEYNFADVTGGAFTQVTTTGSIQSIEFNIDDLRSVVRMYRTIGGTSSPQFIAGSGVFVQ